jgi:hypothetical protein
MVFQIVSLRSHTVNSQDCQALKVVFFYHQIMQQLNKLPWLTTLIWLLSRLMEVYNATGMKVNQVAIIQWTQTEVFY